MKLNIPERILLLQILPVESDFVGLKVLQDLRNVLGFSEENHKEYEIKSVPTKDGTGTNFTWNDKGSEELEIEIGEKAQEIIKEQLEELDKEKKLKPQYFSVYEKFVQDK